MRWVVFRLFRIRIMFQAALLDRKGGELRIDRLIGKSRRSELPRSSQRNLRKKVMSSNAGPRTQGFPILFTQIIYHVPSVSILFPLSASWSPSVSCLGIHFLVLPPFPLLKSRAVFPMYPSSLNAPSLVISASSRSVCLYPCPCLLSSTSSCLAFLLLCGAAIALIAPFCSYKV